jgi:hypothetical protein
VDTIRQLEEVVVFKARVLASDSLQAAAAEPLAAARGGSRYVTSLLEQATPEQLTHVLNWQAADWIAFVGDSVRQFSLLLDLVGREDDMERAGQPREAYMSIAAQQLNPVRVAGPVPAGAVAAAACGALPCLSTSLH